MIQSRAISLLLGAVWSCSAVEGLHAQAKVTATIQRQAATSSPRTSSPRSTRPLPPAVLWLTPLQPPAATAPQNTHPPYTLLQKNRMFTPHILVVPVGAPVNFPNADPYFHNVFSLYNGKRFDLGLYEKGTDRQVVFNHEGVSYIFCNIHPEMSAVVLALRTPWWAQADENGAFTIDRVSSGDYEAHLWVEGVDARELDRWTHVVHVAEGSQSVGNLAVNPDALSLRHTNKFGEPYLPEIKPY